ncbi:MAG: GFA family protein [Gammaproteobacteria bacterium]
MEVTGGCLCRQVRFRITAAPIVTRVCWCRLCQYLGSGSSTVNVCFPSNAITIEGEMKDYSNVAESGNVMHRRFCPNCGTALFSEAEARPHLIFVRAGTLDDPEVAKPSATIWTSEAPSWGCFDPNLPQIERQPPPAG